MGWRKSANLKIEGKKLFSLRKEQKKSRLPFSGKRQSKHWVQKLFFVKIE
jgi:hypothetical protein